MPPAKKAKNDGEEKKGKGKGYNKYGSKGTIRCRKCQKNKWSCKFQNPEDPCDYCAARRLVCGPKLMTPRKEAEKAAREQASRLGLHAAFQLSNAIAMGNQLQINTNVPLTNSNAGFNLSSAQSDYNPNPFVSSASSSPPAGGHATYPALTPIMPALSLGQPPRPPVPSPPSSWQFQPRESSGMFLDTVSLSPDTASVTASSIIDPREPVSPAAPHRRPAEALAHSALPIVSLTGIPQFPRFNAEEEWHITKKLWLDTDSLVARFVRTNKMPSGKRGKRTAGKWSHLEGEDEERKGVRNSIHLSTKSAPTVVSL